MTGNKHETEAADVTSAGPCVPFMGTYCIPFQLGYMVWQMDVVGERNCQRRSDTATSRGAAVSDYAGMSNDKAGENPARRKPKVSWGR